jgi:AcrR family transcriptional regulator
VARVQNPRGQGERLREEILEHGMQVLAGAAHARDVTIRAVARAAGVTPPALYLHFPDRAALLRALVERGFRAFDQFLDAAGQQGSGPAEELRRRCHAYVQFAHRHPGEYRVVFSAAGLGPGELAVSEGEEHPGAPSFRALVDAVAAVTSGDSAPLLKATQLWSFLHGLVDLRLTKPELPWPDLDELIDTTLADLHLAPER